MSKCECGKVKSKYGTMCKSCYAAKDAADKAKNAKLLETGICPACGGKFKRNLSLHGWWQCEQLGAEGFRKDASRPSCNMQFFV